MIVIKNPVFAYYIIILEIKIMASNNRVILLKEISSGFSTNGDEVRGVVRLSPLSNHFSLNISIVNLSKTHGGNYILIYKGENCGFLSLPSTDGGKFTINENCKSLLVAFLANNKITPVIFGKLSKDGEDWESLVKIAEKHYQINDTTASESSFLAKKTDYDDEAVATENYYEYDEVKNEQNDCDGVYTKSDGTEKQEETKSRPQNDERYEDDFFQVESEKLFNKEMSDNVDFKEKFNDSYGRTPNLEEDFFDKIASELTPVFEKNPPEENLSSMVHNSRWVKVSGGNEKHFVVGIISEKNTPVYVCYGIPGKYGVPPAEIKGYSSFIPISPFDLKGKGYWVMYQCAKTGEIVN